VKKIQIFMQLRNILFELTINDVVLRESNNAKQHAKTHTCSQDHPCTTHGQRHLENDDWVKFGHVLWASRGGERQRHVLGLYQKAWRAIYSSEAPLVDGGPVNFLRNPQYTCAKPIPWLSRALAEDDELPEEHSGFQMPADPADPAQAGPSTSLRGEDPAPASSGSRGGLDESLEMALNSVQCNVIHYPLPKIQDGFFPAFPSYLEQPSEPHQRLRVVFPIVPPYMIYVRDYKPTPDINLMKIDREDIQEISQADSHCFYPAKDQVGCPPGRVRYFCSSWVSL
jgi:hypothetical protein